MSQAQPSQLSLSEYSILLEQENSRLRLELAEYKKRKPRPQPQPQVALERVAGILETREEVRPGDAVEKLPDSSSEARRDRILEATATAANALLTVKDFDKAVNTALRILGECLDTDRISVHKNFDHPNDTAYKHWQTLYNWNSPNTTPQVAHPQAGQGSYESIYEWYAQMEQGQSIHYLIEDAPAPFRSGQVAIGVKATHLVPIFVEDKFWGVVGLDDCQVLKQRTSAEISVLKIAANCIGSAIQRERTQQVLLQAEQERTRCAAERSQELERINAELQQALDLLSESEERFRTLFELSSEGFYYTEIDPPCPVALSIEEQCDWLYQNIRVVKANPAFAAMYGVDHPDELIGLRNADVHVAESEKNAAFIRGTIEKGYRFQNLETEEIDSQGQLRYFLNNGVYTLKKGHIVSAWSTQVDITELRQTQQALLHAEQGRVAELAKANDELQQRDREIQRSYRLLSVVAQVTQDLLEAEDVETAIPAALQAVGESANMSRVLLHLEQLAPTTQRLSHCVAYEWTAAGINDHRSVGLDVMDNDDYQVLIQPMYNGQSIWRVIDDLPDITRQPLERLDIQSTGVVPVFIEGRYIGCVAFDDCVTPRQWSQQEINVLTAAAESIGAALHRKQLVDRLVTEQIRAEQERTAELAEINVALEAEVMERSRAERLARGQTDALVSILNALADEPTLDNFLGFVLQSICDQLGDRSGGIWLYNETQHITLLHLNYENGNIQQGHQITRPGTGQHVVQQWDADYMPLLREQKLLIQDIQQFANVPAYAPYYAHNQRQGIKTILVVAIFFGDTFLGNITLRRTDDRAYKPEELELAQALAHQAALAIQLTRLAEQGKQTAVIEERNRMAREMHDTLAQAFTSIGMQLEAAARLFNRKPEQAASCLTYARELARSGLAEARRSVWALQPEAEDYLYLAATLQRIVAQRSAETALSIQLSVNGAAYVLPPDIGMNLLRIAQEALNNAICHAHAQTVSLTLTYAPNQIQLQIQDDGQGFDPQLKLGSGSFGLIGMQQRSDRIGGELLIASCPGQGTEVKVKVIIQSGSQYG